MNNRKLRQMTKRNLGKWTREKLRPMAKGGNKTNGQGRNPDRWKMKDVRQIDKGGYQANEHGRICQIDKGGCQA